MAIVEGRRIETQRTATTLGLRGVSSKEEQQSDYIFI